MESIKKVGLLQLDPDVAGELAELLDELGYTTLYIDWFDQNDDLSLVIFHPNDAYLDSFLLNQNDAIWIAVEKTFEQSRFTALLEFGVHDVLVAEDLGLSALLRAIKRAENTFQLMRKLATHDALTGCLNAEGFVEEINRVKDQTAVSGCPFGLAFLDLVEFQQINQQNGYSIANQLLRMVAQRLALVMAGRFIVGRLGADAFLLLIEELSDKNELMQSLELIRSSFNHHFELFGRAIKVNAFIGAVLYPETLGDAEELIAQAQEAMNTGRYRKQQVFLYDRAASPWFQMDIAAEIRRALREDEFRLHYQPRIDLRDNRVVGMEALIRWAHPKYGEIPPSDFIHVAENSGMILPLGNWILAKAKSDMTRLSEAGFRNLSVAINLSFKQLQDPHFCESLPARIEQWSSGDTQLEFELTETAVLSNPELVKSTLESISQLGVKISLDDFGTGYSALVHVQEFPISIVKIDKSFVQRMESNSSARNIVESIISFAHRLNLEVVGEGIEQQAQLESLKDMGCEQGQGFYFARAMPLEELITFAGERNKKLSSPEHDLHTNN